MEVVSGADGGGMVGTEAGQMEGDQVQSIK